MKKLLFVNSNVNRETSRTNRLTNELIKLLNENNEYQVTELILEEENIQALNSQTLGKRYGFVLKCEFNDEMFKYAHQFMDADLVVISAPYWDLAYPAMLKNYIEATSVAGITYNYGPDGIPVGNCKAEKIYYVTTCGGFIRNQNFGYDTIKALGVLFGINDSVCIAAEGLDVKTNDADAIMSAAIAELPTKLK